VRTVIIVRILMLFIYHTNRIRFRRIRTPPIQFDADINTYNITLLQFTISGNAMNYLFIYRNTGCCRIGYFSRYPFKHRNCIVLNNKIINFPINLFGTHLWCNQLRCEFVRFPKQQARLSHLFNLVGFF
jgi:hypothetical protein